MKIYTKTGDLGETSLWGKAGLKRTQKNSARVEAYGSVDETNAVIGAARAEGVGSEDLDGLLALCQHRLFGVGADLSNINPDRQNRISESDVLEMEGWIDRLDAELPPLKQFILPGGSKASATLHLARTVARRSERRLLTFVQEDSSYAVHLKYMNRLSDFLFVAARRANQLAGVPDIAADF